MRNLENSRTICNAVEVTYTRDIGGNSAITYFGAITSNIACQEPNDVRLRHNCALSRYVE